MKDPARWSIDNLLSISAIKGKTSVKTQYACQVIAVSADGRFVDLVHNTLEWQACSDGDTLKINEYGKDTLCAATKPWIVCDIPVEETYERGQWKVRVRPKVGDRGILSVFYHDTKSLKEKGGFQAPEAIRIMAIDSASFRPGLPNHADVNAEQTPYPSDDEWELTGKGVSVKFTSPVDDESESPNKMEVNIGNVNFTVTVPQDGDPTVVFNVPDGSVSVTSKTATVTADTTINGNLQVNGDINATGSVTAEGEVTGNGVALSAHMHGVTNATAVSVPTPPATDWPTTPPITTP